MSFFNVLQWYYKVSLAELPFHRKHLLKNNKCICLFVWVIKKLYYWYYMNSSNFRLIIFKDFTSWRHKGKSSLSRMICEGRHKSKINWVHTFQENPSIHELNFSQVIYLNTSNSGGLYFEMSSVLFTYFLSVRGIKFLKINLFLRKHLHGKK